MVAKDSPETVMKESHRDAIIDACFKLVNDKNWTDITTQQIANEVGLSIDDFSKIFYSKIAILRAYNERVDRLMLSEAATLDITDNHRENLFELLMIRFDILARDRIQVIKIIKEIIQREPLSGVIGLIDARKSVQLILETAMLSSNCIIGEIKIKTLLIVYLKAIRVWIGDSSQDLSKTMADLDRSLKYIEKLWTRINICKSESPLKTIITNSIK